MLPQCVSEKKIQGRVVRSTLPQRLWNITDCQTILGSLYVEAAGIDIDVFKEAAGIEDNVLGEDR